MLEVSIFKNARDNVPKTVSTTWPELLAQLSTHDFRAVKDGPAWSPATFNGTRSKANTVWVFAAVFDLDHCPEETLAALGERLKAHTYVFYSTFTPGGYRLVLPLKTAVPGAHWERVWHILRDRFDIPADEHCKDSSHIYYLPTCQIGGEPVACDNLGELVDPGPLDLPPLEKSPIFIEGGVKNSPSIGPEKILENSPVDLFEIRRQLRTVRRVESMELIRLMLDGESLAPSGSRDHTLNRLAGILAAKIIPPISVETAMELVRPALIATPTEPEGLDHWLAEFKDQYERALKRRHIADEKDAAIKGVLMRPKVEGDDWKAQLIPKLNQDGEVTGYKSVGANAELVLMNDAAWAGNVRFNEVTKEIDILGGPLMGESTSVLDVATMNWLVASDYGINLNSRAVAEQLLRVAKKNAYDPLADWLRSLKWDGTARVDSFLVDFFGATAESPEYLRRVGACWLISAVARALRPGCKVDSVVVLQGAQGVGKSRSLQAMGAPYFSDTKFNIHDRDGRMMASRFWFIELAELANMRRAEDEALKAFFSAQRDDIRMPYARATESFARRCIFTGSTNDDEFLTDPTGARRYWPVMVHKTNVEGLAIARDQLWAEAVERFSAGESWWLTEADAVLAAHETSEVTKTPARVEQILNWWMKLKTKPETVSILTVAEGLGFLQAQITNSLRQEIGVALKLLKFRKSRKRVSGVPTWVHSAPANLMEENISNIRVIK